MDFSIRSDVKEHLDDPNLDKESFRKAYVDINRCNVLLGGDAITLNAIKDLIGKHPKKSYTIYDMGCGDGHILRKISETFINQGVEMNLVGIDLSEDIIEIAKEASKRYKNITFIKGDILELDSAQGCDILLCTLTMHHFSEKDILRFAKTFSQLASLGVIVNDLQRSRLSYILFKFFSLFFMRSQMAKEDGLTSIRRGFRKLELNGIAVKLKGLQHRIQWKWAFRYVWVMEPARQN